MNQEIRSKGDVPIANNVETITRDTGFYAEVLTRAHQDGLSEVQTTLSQIPAEGNERTAIVKAEIRTSKGLFHAYGDASPDSVEADFFPHLIRVAETRAKARALRDAVNMGRATPEDLHGSAVIPGHHASSSQGESRDAGANTSKDGFIRMTDAQQRYLYRLVGERGFKGDEARKAILNLFEVTEFSEISKSAAREKIDQLLREEGSTEKD